MEKIQVGTRECYITRNEDGEVSVWRPKKGQSPVRPRRLRKGDITHIRAGFISVENPPEEKGHWICENLHIKEYVFIEDAAKRFDGIISWSDEPKLVKMGFVIEVE